MPERSPNQLRPVVGRHDLDAGRKRFPNLRDPCLERARDLDRVLCLLHDHDAADDLALAVELRDPATLVVADLDVANVLDRDRFAILRVPDHEGF